MKTTFVFLLFFFGSIVFAGSIVERKLEGNEFGTAIMIAGDIDQNLSNSLIAFTQKYDPIFDTYFILDNPGGLVSEVQLLKSAIETLALKVFTQTGKPMKVFVLNRCHSACIAVFSLISVINADSSFVGALELKVSENAVFGFHAATNGQAVSIEGTEKYLDLLKKGGVSENWVKANRALFNKTDVTNILAKELLKSEFMEKMKDFIF
jgi:hypothetical protein